MSAQSLNTQTCKFTSETWVECFFYQNRGLESGDTVPKIYLYITHLLCLQCINLILAACKPLADLQCGSDNVASINVVIKIQRL